MKEGRFGVAAWLVVAALVFSMTAPVCADDFLFSKKFYGFVTLGASGWCLYEAYDARKAGNDFYDQYKVAGTSLRASELYDESKRSDTRSALLLGLGVGTLVYSVHLLLSDKKDELPPPKMDRGLVEVKGVAVDVTGDPLRRGVKVKFKKGF